MESLSSEAFGQQQVGKRLESLPAGWREHFDSSMNRVFFEHKCVESSLQPVNRQPVKSVRQSGTVSRGQLVEDLSNFWIYIGFVNIA